MGSEISTLSEPFRANIALEWTLTSVPAHMDLQGARPHEAMVALIAFKRTLASVPSKMVRQVPMGCEGSTTVFKGAVEGFFSIVDASVRLKIAFLSESFATALKIAHKRLLSDLP